MAIGSHNVQSSLTQRLELNMIENDSIMIEVYLDDGRVAWYTVANQAKAREHVSKIVATGWRSTVDDGTLEHYPPHRIDKIKILGGITTEYPTKYRGT
jgi:hypothetical protein